MDWVVFLLCLQASLHCRSQVSILLIVNQEPQWGAKTPASSYACHLHVSPLSSTKRIAT